MKKILTALVLALPFAANAFAQDAIVEMPADSVTVDPYARFRGRTVTDIYNEGARLNNQGDFAEALECFQYAADQGHSLSQFQTGDSYFYGTAGKTDNDLAIKYLTLASEQGHDEAQFLLGLLYHGIKDYDNAIKYWELAIAQNNAASMSNLGLCYDRGQGKDCDEEMALYWFRRAAALGDGTAACNIGMYYELGKADLTVDIDKAIEWYTKAWNLKNYDAKEALDRLQSEK